MRRHGVKKKRMKRKATRPKRHIAPGATHRLRASAAGLQEQLERRTRERDEALEQQAATLEVLKVISSSPGDLTPVFDAILEHATRLCEATHGHVWRFDGEQLHAVSVRGDPKFVEWLRQHNPVRPAAGSAADRIVRGERFEHMADRRAEDAYRDNQTFRGFVDAGGIRTSLAVALRKGETLLGMINVYRQEVRPFTDKQIELVQNFAAQAVIAIENARLLNEPRQRTDDLSESLEQQTATSEVLKIISSSPGELLPVFQGMLANAMRICEAKFGHLSLYDGKSFRSAYLHNAPPSYREFWNGGPVHPSPNTGLGRVVRTKEIVHIPDLKADSAYAERDPLRVAAVERAGTRTCLFVPMLKENRLVGVIAIYRQEVRPFTDKQIELVQNFASQAVIAIENARLLNELRESLEQQTATSEVLKVISRSPGDLEPVFNAMLANATRICEATFGHLWLFEGSVFRAVAVNGTQGFVDHMRHHPMVDLQKSPGIPLDRLARTRKLVHITDLRTDDSYIRKVTPQIVALVETSGARTFVSVPMLKDGDLVGAINLYRQEVRPFTDKQIELVQNFASQAVIAIENTRLLNELRESLQQQTATADVLKVISSSPGDMKPVFEAMLANALHICDAKFGHILLYDGERYHAAYLHEVPSSYREFWEQHGPILPSPSSGLARLARTKQISHIPDLKADAAYAERDPLRVVTVEQAGARSLLAVPMLKENELIGAIIIYRQELRPFTDKQIELVKNFAAQAVIAIENTRLLKELRQRTDDLSESLEQQTATSEVLQTISSSQGELQPVFDSLLANATRLCAAKYGTLFLCEGDDLRVVAQHNTPAALAEQRRRDPILRPGANTAIRRSTKTKQAVQIADIVAEPTYSERDPAQVAAVELGGYRAVLSVPMLKDDEVVGAINIYRQEAGAFDDKQVDLVKNFAAQAVIAIENARLLNELRESLQQQTATADVLKVISRSAFDLRTVLQTLVESAARLCDADQGTITREVDGTFYRAATYGLSAEFTERVRDLPVQFDRGSAIERALVDGKVVHIPDIREDTDYTFSAGLKLGGFRTTVAVPMLREGVAVFWRWDAKKCGHSRTSRLSWYRHLPTRQQSQSRTFDCSNVWRPARASWRSRWRTCAPHRIASFRHRSSLLLASSPLALRMRSRTRSISSITSQASRSN
jgi:GAF domain-containing protein